MEGIACLACRSERQRLFISCWCSGPWTWLPVRTTIIVPPQNLMRCGLHHPCVVWFAYLACSVMLAGLRNIRTPYPPDSFSKPRIDSKPLRDSKHPSGEAAGGAGCPFHSGHAAWRAERMARVAADHCAARGALGCGRLVFQTRSARLTGVDDLLGTSQNGRFSWAPCFYQSHSWLLQIYEAGVWVATCCHFL